jgi:hypothetical protein
MDAHRWPDDAPARYQFRVRGALDPRWSGWFAGLRITHDADGSTLLAGPLADQAALYGVISRMRDLGLTLLAVARLPPIDSQE